MVGWEPWSSGYGRRLISRRLWVRIPAPYTGWTIFTYICCKNYNDCVKRRKSTKRLEMAHFLIKTYAMVRLMQLRSALAKDIINRIGPNKNEIWILHI